MSDVVDVGEVLVCVVMGVEVFGGMIVVLYPGVWVPGACVGILGGTLGRNRGRNGELVHLLVDEQLWRLQRIVERGRLDGLHRLGCFATHLTVRDFIPPSQDREHCGNTQSYIPTQKLNNMTMQLIHPSIHFKKCLLKLVKAKNNNKKIIWFGIK